MMTDTIEKIIRRTYRTFYDDGLVELALGTLFIAVGIWLSFWSGIASASFSGLLLALGLPALILGGILIFNKVIKRLKERITFPRTGYVSYRQDQNAQSRWLPLATAVFLVVTIVFLPDSFNRIQFVAGMLLGAILLYMGYRVSVRRFYFDGMIALVLGVGLTLLEFEEIQAMALLFVGSGLVLLITGALALILYLRQHPEQEEVLLGEGS